MHTIHTYLPTHVHTYRHTNRQTYRHTEIQTYRYACMHTCIPTYLPIYLDKVRFRNHISTLPQPNFDDSATKIRHASATKKRRFRNQKRTDSATKNNRFRNQKKTIPQPKKGDSATKTRGFRNQKKAIHQPPSAWLRNQHPRHNCGHSQHSIVSRCWGWVGWGGVG